MDSKVEEQFEAVARQAVEDAERIRCPFPDFIEGLETIVEALQARLASAREEHDAHTEKGGEA